MNATITPTVQRIVEKFMKVTDNSAQLERIERLCNSIYANLGNMLVEMETTSSSS